MLLLVPEPMLLPVFIIMPGRVPAALSAMEPVMVPEMEPGMMESGLRTAQASELRNSILNSCIFNITAGAGS
jgi:hypothetical protein